MIGRVEITGVHYQPDDELKAYIRKKIGRLDVYLPKHSRASAHAEVRLRQSSKKNEKQYSCEVILHLPIENLAVHESTITMQAAFDIAEGKLKAQIKKYKGLHSPAKSRHLLRRLLGRGGSK